MATASWKGWNMMAIVQTNQQEHLPGAGQALTLAHYQRDGQAIEQYAYDPQVIDKAVMLGDMKQMDAKTRLAFYRAVCLSVGVNPLTQPFTALERQDKTVWLYANSVCAQQLAALHKISFEDPVRRHETVFGEPLYTVQITARLPDGRALPAQSVVSLTKKKKVQRGTWPDGNPKWIDALDEDGEPLLIPLRGEALANAIMKADTKAQRRATLALIGLGWMQSDFEGQTVTMNLQTGELMPDGRMTPARRLLDQPSEQTKSTTAHIADLSGDQDDLQDALQRARGHMVADNTDMAEASPPIVEPPSNERAATWRRLAAAQERMGWSPDKKKNWENRQARRFQRTFADLPLATLRGLIAELEGEIVSETQDASQKAPGQGFDGETAPESSSTTTRTTAHRGASQAHPEDMAVWRQILRANMFAVTNADMRQVCEMALATADFPEAQGNELANKIADLAEVAE